MLYAYPNPLPNMPVDHNEDGKICLDLFGAPLLGDGIHRTWLTVNDARSLAAQIMAHVAAVESE